MKYSIIITSISNKMKLVIISNFNIIESIISDYDKYINVFLILVIDIYRKLLTDLVF
jgi:hypothetical protein